ncbi:glycosyltransferase family 2 protein [Hyphomonas sp.]|uniref:glycosyltransferase family 2 protein n=1 Tax=Hyphomonas sp. TaxID=87 RepID=UPI00356369B7
MTTGTRDDHPSVSVLMANYNSAPYLAAAIASVLGQDFTSLELILVDDGSSDDSVALAERIAADDPRLRVFSGKRFGGPAPVRNFALDQARGDWVAVVDSDDLLHPQRFSRLMAAIEASGADILIDDLAIFDGDGSSGVDTMFEGPLATTPSTISEPTYIRSNFLSGKGTKLGYAKPVIRRASLEANGIRYNEAMRIGEDYDLIVRLLGEGCVMATLPETLYFYRKHSASISHRLDMAALTALEAAAVAAATAPDQSPAVLAANTDRLKSIRRAIGFDRLVSAIKAADVATILSLLVRQPSAFTLLYLPVAARLRSLFPKHRPASPEIVSMIADLDRSSVRALQ